METFADYILSEKDYIKKMEIAYYLHKREGIFFDTSVVLKTEIARMFVEKMKIDVDENVLLTACLLCGCRKNNNPQDYSKFKSFAKDGSDYLRTLGFDERFCTICEQMNRYSGSEPREPESDILELVDNFCGMVLDRPERRGFPIDEALVLMEYRNLKGKQNRFLEEFKKFVYLKEKVKAYIMGYKYDKQNGYRNADQIGADIEEFNPAVVRAINQAKECEKEIDPDKATRSYINKTSLNIQIENKPKEIINESEEKEKQQMPSYYIAAGIKKEMEQEL